MNIYELHLIQHPRNHLDYHDGFVVVAKSARDARKMASRWSSDDMSPRTLYPEWLDRTQTTCLKLGVPSGKVPAGVVLASFNAG